MSPRFAFALCSVLSFAVATPLAAQSSDTLAIAPGARLRIATWSDTLPAPAILRRQTNDGLIVSGACHACSPDSIITWGELQSVDVYTTRPHDAVDGAIGAGKGLLLGTLLGVVSAYVAVKLCSASNNSENCTLFAVLVPAGGVAGTIIGVVIGMQGEDERWVGVWPKTRQ